MEQLKRRLFCWWQKGAELKELSSIPKTLRSKSGCQAVIVNILKWILWPCEPYIVHAITTSIRESIIQKNGHRMVPWGTLQRMARRIERRPHILRRCVASYVESNVVKLTKIWIAFFFCLRKTFRSLDIGDRLLQLLWPKYMNSLYASIQHTLYRIHTYKVKVRVDKCPWCDSNYKPLDLQPDALPLRHSSTC